MKDYFNFKVIEKLKKIKDINEVKNLNGKWQSFNNYNKDIHY